MHIKQYPRTFCRGLLGVPWLLVGSALVATPRWYCRCFKSVLWELCSEKTEFMQKTLCLDKRKWCQSETGLKINMCFGRALTWYIRSPASKRASLWLQPPYPEGGVFLRDLFSELNSSGFRKKPCYPAIDHTLVSEKGVVEKDFATTKKKTHLL